MCMSSLESKMSNTKIYVGTATHNERPVHVIAYQNSAQNLDHQPNAMILPFPASEPMTPNNVVDTREFPSFLDDIGVASKHKALRRREAFADKSFGFDNVAWLFDNGSYTVALSSNVDLIKNALKDVPAEKRPFISDEILHFLSTYYEGWQFAVCCWNGKIAAEPLLWWYEPKDPTHLFIPTMEAHDGRPPNLNQKIWADHLISVGPTTAKNEADCIMPLNHVRFSKEIPAAHRHLMPTSVVGLKVDDRTFNGDMWVKVDELQLEGDQIPLLKRGKFSTKEVKDGFERKMIGWH